MGAGGDSEAALLFEGEDVVLGTISGGAPECEWLVGLLVGPDSTVIKDGRSASGASACLTVVVVTGDVTVVTVAEGEHSVDE